MKEGRCTRGIKGTRWRWPREDASGRGWLRLVGGPHGVQVMPSNHGHSHWPLRLNAILSDPRALRRSKRNFPLFFLFLPSRELRYIRIQSCSPPPSRTPTILASFSLSFEIVCSLNDVHLVLRRWFYPGGARVTDDFVLKTGLREMSEKQKAQTIYTCRKYATEFTIELVLFSKRDSAYSHLAVIELFVINHQSSFLCKILFGISTPQRSKYMRISTFSSTQ